MRRKGKLHELPQLIYKGVELNAKVTRKNCSAWWWIWQFCAFAGSSSTNISPGSSVSDIAGVTQHSSTEKQWSVLHKRSITIRWHTEDCILSLTMACSSASKKLKTLQIPTVNYANCRRLCRWQRNEVCPDACILNHEIWLPFSKHILLPLAFTSWSLFWKLNYYD